MIRNNHTNNYAETIFKVVKDKLLKRSRLFNPVMLFEFVITDLVKYFSERLMKYVSNRKQFSEKINNELILSDYDASIADVYDKKSLKTHKVEMLSGKCQCQRGSDGAKCEHSSFLISKNFFLPNHVCSHLLEVKSKLYFIANGVACKNIEKFRNIHGINSTVLNFPTENDARVALTIPDNDDFDSMVADDGNMSVNSPNTNDADEINLLCGKIDEVCNDMKQMVHDKEGFRAVKNFIEYYTKHSKNSTNRGKLIWQMKNIKEEKPPKKMRVQKSSIARRVTKNSTKNSLGSGRTTIYSFLKPRCIQKKARPHSLSKAVEKNQQNSGKF